jgi:hypothetical protein
MNSLINRTPYWLRGVIGGIAAAFFISIVGYFMTNNTGCEVICGLGVIFPILPGIYISEMVKFLGIDYAPIVVLAVTLIIWIGGGALVGALIARRKHG